MRYEKSRVHLVGYCLLCISLLSCGQKGELVAPGSDQPLPEAESSGSEKKPIKKEKR